MNKPLSEHPKLLLDPYVAWTEKEGVPVTEDFGVDLLKCPTAHWPRFGVEGGVVNLKGRGDFVSIFVLDLKPGAQTSPQKHLFEEVVYVLEGHGSTTVESSDGRKHSFEWGPKSLFALPLNARYQHFNASGQEHARLASTNNVCMMLNLFHNDAFVFDNPYEFPERQGSQKSFSGEGDFIPVRPGRNMWETNFVPDVSTIGLHAYADRGAGSSNIKFILADGVLSGHMSEMPAGTYKKAHRHGSGTHVICITGHGYSLLWYEGDKDFERFDWKHGGVCPPCNGQFHQHFNLSNEPSRYLALGIGNVRYPFTNQKRETMVGRKGEQQRSSLSIKQGGHQVEFEDQDPRIHRLWLEEMKKAGVTPRMEKYAIPA